MILIDFQDVKAGNKALKALQQAFTRAGANIASIDVSPRTQRSSGVSYRTVDITFTDNQKVTLSITQSGDVFQVKINGHLTPIKNQGDQVKAIGEIANALVAGRQKFQAKLARTVVQLPKTIKTAAPKIQESLQNAEAALDEQIAATKARANELRAELGEPALDAVENPDATPEDSPEGDEAALDAAGDMKPGIYVRYKDDSPPTFLGANMQSARKGYERWANSGKGKKVIDQEEATRFQKTLHWIERYVGKDVEGREAWGNQDLSDDILDDTHQAQLDGEGEPVEVDPAAAVAPVLDNAADVDVPHDSLAVPEVLEAQKIAAGVIAGETLDGTDISTAIFVLEQALDVVETNMPINLAAGNTEQAELEEKNAEQFRSALVILKAA